jgi:hypothetical protein
MENPFLTPPQVESPQSRSWGMGFTYGFQGPAQSSMAPADIGPEDADAFDQGVLAGQDAAINGVPLTNSCVDLHVEGPDLFSPDGISGSFEAGVTLWKGFRHLFGKGLFSGVLAIVELSIALETFSDDPNEALTQAATSLQGQLQTLGFDQGMQLLIGGGVDTATAGCELLLTPIHRDLDAATAAANSLGRAQWLVASWRTDQSGGVTIVASS